MSIFEIKVSVIGGYYVISINLDVENLNLSYIFG
jgi:hypothetical protein